MVDHIRSDIRDWIGHAERHRERIAERRASIDGRESESAQILGSSKSTDYQLSAQFVNLPVALASEIERRNLDSGPLFRLMNNPDSVSHLGDAIVLVQRLEAISHAEAAPLGTTAPGFKRPASPCPLTPDGISRFVGRAWNTLRPTAEQAGVTLPKKGQHSYEFSSRDVYRIAQARAERVKRSRQRQGWCRERKQWNRLLSALHELMLD